MQKNLLSVGFLALCFVLAASVATATPQACDVLVMNNAVDVAPMGLVGNSITCIENGLIFSNFQYTVASGSGTPEIDISKGGVTVNGGQVNINFNPNLASPTGIGDLHFVFQVSGFVTGASLQNAGLLSSIQEANCTGAENLNGVCSGNVIWNTSDNDNQSSFCNGNTSGGTGFTSVCNYGSGVDGIWVFKDISTQIGNGHLTSFTEDFETSSGTPEPMTMSLMGIGLLGIGLLGRRIRK